MKQSKRKKLEDAGWKVGSAADFLGLTKEEESLVAMKLALARDVQARRKRLSITQAQLAKRLGSSQSRVAKIEKADKSVSLELLVRSLLSLGASREDIGEILGARVGQRTRRTTRRATLAES